MTRLLFVSGHFWLFVAIVLFVGRTTARHNPVIYSFLDGGAWLHPATYHSLVGVAAFIGILSIIAAFITFRRSIASPHET